MIREYDTIEEAIKHEMFAHDHFNKKLYRDGKRVFLKEESYEHVFSTAVKRGNPKYIAQVLDKFETILKEPPVVFFKKEWGVKKTKALYVSGTMGKYKDILSYPKNPNTTEYVCMTRIHNDIGYDLGYLSFGKHFNAWINNLKQHFKENIVYLRAWHSQEKGNIHFHVILYFENKEFNVVEHINRYGKLTYRLPINSKDRKHIKDAWKLGFIDIKCISEMGPALKDLLKYITATKKSGKYDLNNALLWYFQRQSFGKSTEFFKLIYGKDFSVKDPNNKKYTDVADLIRRKSNSNFELIRIEIFPMIKPEFLRLNKKFIQIRLTDPPPKFPFDEYCLTLIENQCDLVELKRSEKYDVPVFIYKKQFGGS